MTKNLFDILLLLQEKCLQNPKHKQPLRTPLNADRNQANSRAIVHIPCEICQESIDLPNWSLHIVGRFYIRSSIKFFLFFCFIAKLSRTRKTKIGTTCSVRLILFCTSTSSSESIF